MSRGAYNIYRQSGKLVGAGWLVLHAGMLARWLIVFHLRRNLQELFPPFNLRHPPGFQANKISKGKPTRCDFLDLPCIFRNFSFFLFLAWYMRCYVFNLAYLLRQSVGAFPHEVPHRDELYDVSAGPLARAVDEAHVVAVQCFHRSVVGTTHANTARA